jgi:hypothetical protein
LEKEDGQALMYVVGYAVKSEVKQRKGCESCQELMIMQAKEGEYLQLTTLPLITEEQTVTEKAYEFVEEINRGGLKLPTPASFSMGLKAWLAFKVIDNSPLIEKKFWDEECGGKNKKRVFARIIKSYN